MAYEKLLDVPALPPLVTAVRTAQRGTTLDASVLAPPILVANGDRQATGRNATQSSLPSYGSDDALFGLSLEEQMEFFQRVSIFGAGSDPSSLAATLLRHWLTGRGARKEISNARIKDHPSIKAQLLNYRSVYCSQQSTDWVSGNVLAGVVPRLRRRDEEPEAGWDGATPLDMNYTARSFDIVSLTRYLALQGQQMLGLAMSPQDLIDLDLFASLHSTSLVSNVTVEGSRIGPRNIAVVFKKFECYVSDNYNWDAGKHLTVPNPDHRNRYQVRKPVRPEEEHVRIYHDHQLELERYGMAHSFDFRSEQWTVVDPVVTADFSVTY